MKRLIIVGAGGFAREVFWTALDSSSSQSDWSLYGFLSDYPDDLDAYDYPISIIGAIRDYVPTDEDLFVMAIAEPVDKLRIAKELEGRGANFITLIHPTAIVRKNSKVGRGCVICPGAMVSCDVSLGNFVTFNAVADVGHDAHIGDGCTLSSYTEVMGHAELGKGVFLGSHASILPKAKVGDFATVGAGSVVLKSVKPRTTVFGVPAKVISTKEGLQEDH